MKKLTLIMVLILALCLIFSGCAVKINEKNATEKLENKGFTVIKTYSSEDELKYATEEIKIQLYTFGGDFNVKVISQTVLAEKDNPEKTCTFIEFEREDHAINYVLFLMDEKTEDDEIKIGREGSTVVITNSEKAQRWLDIQLK